MNDKLPPTLRFGGFVTRHAMALLVTVAGACVFWTLLYALLLVWAICSGDELGGPLTYPVGLLLIAVGGPIAGIVLFLPPTVVAERIAERRQLALPARIAASVLIFGALCLAIAAFAALISGEASVLQSLRAALVLFLIHLVPFGVYWWTAQGGLWVGVLLRRFRMSGRQASE